MTLNPREQKFHDALTRIAKAMPEGWRSEKFTEMAFSFIRADGLTLSLWHCDELRAEVTPRPPALPENERPQGNATGTLRDWGCINYRETAPSATFAFDRPVAQCVKIIERMANTYAPMYADIQKRMVEKRAYLDGTRALAAEMAKLCNDTQHSHRTRSDGTGSFYLRGGRVSADVDVQGPDSVTIKLQSVGANVAREVINLLRKATPESGA